jgi:hypothetical protein
MNDGLSEHSADERPEKPIVGISFMDFLRDGSETPEDYAAKAFEWFKLSGGLKPNPVFKPAAIVDMIRSNFNHNPDFVSKVSAEFRAICNQKIHGPVVGRISKGTNSAAGRVVKFEGYASRAVVNSYRPKGVGARVPNAGEPRVPVVTKAPEVKRPSKIEVSDDVRAKTFLRDPDMIPFKYVNTHIVSLLREFGNIRAALDLASTQKQLKKLEARFEAVKNSLYIVFRSDRTNPQAEAAFRAKSMDFLERIHSIETALASAKERIGK